MRKRFLATVSCLAIVLTLSGCLGKNNPLASESEGSSSSSVSENSNTVKITNPLTGVGGYSKEALAKRPVAVMINNIKVSMPQKGISQADIIYELPVEGGINRLLAVFADASKIPQLGSVRSARHDFIELAMLHNAIYIHFGGSNVAYDKLSQTKWNDIDGMSYLKAFDQDESRLNKMGKEHTYFTNAKLIDAAIKQKNYNTAAKDGEQPDFFKFAKKQMSYDGFVDCNKATVNFSSYSVGVFEYDQDTARYKRSQYGAAQIDANTNEQVSVDNVFILQTTVSDIGNKLKDIDLNKGTGYYLTNGKSQKISFEKQGDINGNFKFKDSQGKEIEVKQGNSWICFAPNNIKVGLE